MQRIATLVAAGLLVAGCGGVEGVDDEAGVELASDAQALTIDFKYDCTGYGTSTGNQMQLWLKTTHATVYINGLAPVGRYDSAYRPPAGSTDKRYRWFTGWTGAPATPYLFVSNTLRQGGAPLRTGGTGGFATVQYGSGSRATQIKYICRVHAAPASTVPAAQAPIPFVLQWINDYRASGTLSRVVLHRDGTYDATYSGHVEKGVFTGPRTWSGSPQGPGNSAIDLKLYVSDGSAVWEGGIGNYDGSATFVRAGHTYVLAATLPIDGEDECSIAHGAYGDDDVNADGLYCTCDDGLSYIPALGGCIR